MTDELRGFLTEAAAAAVPECFGQGQSATGVAQEKLAIGDSPPAGEGRKESLGPGATY
jgi:hypothetical protein